MEYDKRTQLLKSSLLNKVPNDTLKELRELKQIRLEEENNDLLRKILNKKENNSFFSKFNPFSLLKGRFKPMNLLKRLGILGLFASVATNFKDSANYVASKSGKYKEDLSITDNIEALVSSVATSIGSIFGISEEATQDAIHSLRKDISGVLDNFIGNTGSFGKEIDSIFSSINDAGGKVLNLISDKASKMTDVFMKQTEEHKEFITVVDKIEELKGSKGYISKDDKQAYDLLMKRGEELAIKLKEDDDFMSRSGYASNIDDFTNQSKKDYNKLREMDNKQTDSDSYSNRLKRSLGMKEVKGVDKVKTDKAIVRYVENAQRNGKVVAKEYKDRYLIIKSAEKKRLESRKAEIEKNTSSHALLNKALEINQKQIEKDPKHKEIYLNNIESIKKQLEESRLKNKDMLQKLNSIGKELSKVDNDIDVSRNYTPKNTPTKKRVYKKRNRGASPVTTSRQENFNLLRENAEVIGEELGIDPKVIIAQQIQENGWTKKKLTGKNNYFNIKADKSWKGKKSKHRVWEIVNGKKVWQEDWFRDYDDPTQSAKDYAQFLKKNKRYKKALEKAGDGATGEEFIDEIANAGYATDPNYAKNIKIIMHGRTFNNLYRESNREFVEEPTKQDSVPQTPTKIKTSKIPSTKTKETPKETIVVDSGVKELADAIKNNGDSTKANNTTIKEKTTVKETVNKSSIMVDFKPSNTSIKELE